MMRSRNLRLDSPAYAMTRSITDLPFARTALGLTAGALLSLPAFAQEPAAPAALKAPQPADLAEAKQLAVKTYAEIAEATCADSLSKAIQLRKDIKAFVATPNVPTHIAAKLSWLEARMPYLQSEALRFAGDPVGSNPGFERALNGWPVVGSVIDYTGDDPQAGLVNDSVALPKITPEALIELAGKAGDDARVISGYHAIEFLLWGEDADPKSAGKRTHTDYVATDDNNAARRGAYLTACADLLVRQLSDLLGEWRSGKPDNYRAVFEKLPVDEALANIFTGAVAVAGAEFAERRLAAPYAAADGTGEQSDFSDTTHIDVLHNVAGLANLAAGAYIGVGGQIEVLGVGMVGLADQISAERGEKLRTAINAAYQAARDLGAPFDQELIGADDAPGRMKIKVTIDALTALAAEMSELAAEISSK